MTAGEAVFWVNTAPRMPAGVLTLNPTGGSGVSLCTPTELVGSFAWSPAIKICLATTLMNMICETDKTDDGTRQVEWSQVLRFPVKM